MIDDLTIGQQLALFIGRAAKLAEHILRIRCAAFGHFLAEKLKEEFTPRHTAPHFGERHWHTHDADAGLHALTDALLGAIGEGDIGDHFPPTDPQWKGAPSSVFLKHAAALIAARGGSVTNIDVTLICERPKIKPHREAMRASLAALLDLSLDRVSVKATTTEAMGFTGREEGLAAQAVAAVEMPV